MKRRDFLKYSVALGMSNIFSPFQRGEAQPLRKVRFSSTTVGLVALTMNVLSDKKFDRKHGIESEIIRAGAQREVQQLTLFKKVDSSVYNLTATVAASEVGATLQGYAPFTWAHVSLVSKPNLKFEKPQDIIGKKIGAFSRATSFSHFEMAFKKYGVDLSKQCKLIFAAPGALFGYLEKGDIDVAHTFEPHTSKFIGSGKYKEIFNLNEQWKKMTGISKTIAFFAGYSDWIDSNIELVRATKAAIIETNEHISKTPDVIDEYKGIFGLEKKEELEAAKKRIPPLYTARWDAEVERSLAADMKELFEDGFIDGIPKGPVVRVQI